MEVIRDIAAVIGGLLSAVSLITVLSARARNIVANFFARVFKKYGNTEPINTEMTEIRDMLKKHIEDEKKFKDDIVGMNEISIEFTKTQCRNIIKNIFYKYKDTKVLPLYEKKTLMSVEELYIKKLHGNSFAALLLEEMSGWGVDYENSHPGEDENGGNDE